MKLGITVGNLFRASVLSSLVVLMLLLRFVIIPAEEAGGWVVALGYFSTGLNLLLLSFSLVLSLWGKIEWGKVWMHVPGIVLCMILTFIVHLQEPHRFKILNDEHALLNQSYAMHLYGEAGTIPQAQIIDGELYHYPVIAGKRSLFFQYLLSLVHDFTGYRPANAFILNFLITGLFFTCLYSVLGLLLKNRLLVFAGLLVVASIPLIAQTATSGGYDLLNVTLILSFILAGRAYWIDPTASRQSLFVMITLALAQTRYESVLYLLGLAGIVALTWVRKKELRISWISTVSPVLLFVPLMLNAHMFHNETLKTSPVMESPKGFMSFHYLGPNLADAANFFFNPAASAVNSLPVAILGLSGILFVLFILAKGKLPHTIASNSTVVPLLTTVAFAILCFLVMASHFWGMLTDPLASRFAMPIYVVATICGIWMLDNLVARRKMHWLITVAGLALVAMNLTSREARARADQEWVLSYFQEWAIAQSHKWPADSTLFACDGTLGLVANQKAVLPVEVINLHPANAIQLLQDGTYENIIVFEPYIKNGDSGQLHPVPSVWELNKQAFSFEVVAEIRLRPPFGARAYRLTALREMPDSNMDD